MSVLALDISSASLAAVELRARGDRTTVVRTVVESLPAGLVSAGEIADMGALATALRGFWRAAGFRGRRVRLGVANRRVLVRMIDMPAIDDDVARRTAVDQAVTEHLPIPAAEAVVDSQPVGRYWSGTESRERRMVVAAHRAMIDDLVATVRAAGLQPVGIDLQAFALLRALLPAPMVIDEGSADTPARVVCHLGTDVTQVVVAVDRRCHFTRPLDAGASQMIRAVADRTGLDPQEAETAMGLCGFAGPIPQGWEPRAAERVRGALAEAARDLSAEIARSLAYYASQPGARPIAGVALTGPGALLHGLDAHLARELEMEVELGDPRRQIESPADLDLTTASRAAVALGLAIDVPEDT